MPWSAPSLGLWLHPRAVLRLVASCAMLAIANALFGVASLMSLQAKPAMVPTRVLRPLA